MIDKHITVSQAANLLGVSDSTIRNWIRAGRIKQVESRGNVLQLAATEIRALKEAIDSGELPYLKSRRNKQAIAGRRIPHNYLEIPEAVEIATVASEIAKAFTDTSQHIVLLELYLLLLLGSERIECIDSVDSMSLVDHWLQGFLELGNYEMLVEELWQNCSQSTKQERNSLVELSDFVFDSSYYGQDLLGLVYMSICSLRKRKNAGSYYTPTSIVKRLISDTLTYVNLEDAKRVVDPCCGSGNFLIHLWLSGRKHFEAAGYSSAITEQRLAHLLTGCDIDQIAVIVTKMNLSLIMDNPDLIPLLQIKCEDILLAKTDKKYDLIIGNPPWGYEFKPATVKKLAKHYQFAQGNRRPESFNLFIEWSLFHLAKDGVLSYVLPESFLVARSHGQARESLLKTCQIRQIIPIGLSFAQVNTPGITLIAQAEKENRVSFAYPNFNLGYYVYGDEFDREIIGYLHKLESIVYLRNNADFGLGIVTGDNQKHLLDNVVFGSEPIIIGTDIQRYNVGRSQKHIIYNRDQFQQVAADSIYRAPEKLVYRFIHREFVVAYDNRQRLCLNSANIVIPRIPDVSLKYVLAILNSRIVQFFRLATDPSVKILRSFIESIPILVCSSAEESIIVKHIDSIIMSKDTVQRRRLYEEIDQILMKYYKLPEAYQTYIRRKSQTVGLL